MALPTCDHLDGRKPLAARGAEGCSPLPLDGGLLLSLSEAILKGVGALTIATHERPDGDAVGSSLGFYLLLKELGREAFVVSPDPFPPAYGFLEGFSEVLVDPALVGSALRRSGCLLTLDCGSFARLGWIAPLVEELGLTLINVDHHRDNELFGHVNAVFPEASSTCELSFSLLEGLGLAERLSPGAAEALYVGLITDTGAFSLENTSERALMVASKLVGLGADPAKVHDRLYGQRDLMALKLWGRAWQRASLALDGRLCWSFLLSSDFEELGLERGSAEGLVESLLRVKGVSLSALLTEEAGLVRVSLRGRCEVDLSTVASAFGGGGHPRASGFRLAGVSLEEAVSVVVDSLKEALSSLGS